MVPYKSNLSKNTCSPISSNCVIWDGPDIPCLELCTGDTISEVIYKIASEYCIIIDCLTELEKRIDVNKLLNACGTNTPKPTDTSLAKVLEIIIDKIDCLSSKI
jgi:hypothetical protein